MDTDNHACPVCGQIDQVQKVSAIVAGQTQHVSGVGYDGSYSGTQVSTLARKLEAPHQPSPGIQGKLIWMSWAVLGIFFGSVAIGSCNTLVSSATQDPVGIYVYGSLFLLALVACIYGVRKQNASNADFERTKLPQWKHKMKRWNQLYYCYRDDVVYIPGEASVPVSRMMEYLYK
jgi:hypothetical protein